MELELMVAWSDAMGSGVPELDDADRRIKLLLLELNQAIADDREGEEIQRLMYQLLTEVVSHCESEERVLTQCSYPLAKGHAALHFQMRSELVHAMQELRNANVRTMRAEYVLLVTQLLVEHMRQETTKYRKYLQSSSASGSQGA